MSRVQERLRSQTIAISPRRVHITTATGQGPIGIVGITIEKILTNPSVLPMFFPLDVPRWSHNIVDVCVHDPQQDTRENKVFVVEVGEIQ